MEARNKQLERLCDASASSWIAISTMSFEKRPTLSPISNVTERKFLELPRSLSGVCQMWYRRRRHKQKWNFDAKWEKWTKTAYVFVLGRLESGFLRYNSQKIVKVNDAQVHGEHALGLALLPLKGFWKAGENSLTGVARRKDYNINWVSLRKGNPLQPPLGQLVQPYQLP